jgi:hypothetical protein
MSVRYKKEKEKKIAAGIVKGTWGEAGGVGSPTLTACQEPSHRFISYLIIPLMPSQF